MTERRPPSRRDPDRWVSISQYARIYGVDRATVYKWLDLGVLKFYRVQRCVRIENIPPAE